MSAGSKLEAALVANAVKLSKSAAASLPITWNLVQVEFAATNFSTFSAAAAPSIHKFLHQSTSLAAQPQVGKDPNEAVQLDSPETAVLQNMPDTVLTEQSKDGLDLVSNSETAAEHQMSACASELQHARTCSDSADCLLEPVAFADVDIGQQRQMLREFEVRQLSKHHASNQSRAKRTNTGQDMKQAGKQSKLVHDTGQRTITSLFRKG